MLFRCLFVALVSFACLTPMARAEEEWRQLFNGKDLTGWTPKIRLYELGDNYADTFRVEDGVLKVSYDKYEGKFNERFGHLFFNEEFSHYRLRVEYRFVGEQIDGGPGWAKKNSGVMIHGRAADKMAVNQKFPDSIEVQLLADLGDGKRKTLNLCTPGTHVVMNGKLHKAHCTNSVIPAPGLDEWVSAEIEVHGSGKVKHYVEGKLAMEYEQPRYDKPNEDGEQLVEKGTISLQSESHPIEFRKIEILVLDE